MKGRIGALFLGAYASTGTIWVASLATSSGAISGSIPLWILLAVQVIFCICCTLREWQKRRSRVQVLTAFLLANWLFSLCGISSLVSVLAWLDLPHEGVFGGGILLASYGRIATAVLVLTGVPYVMLEVYGRHTFQGEA